MTKLHGDELPASPLFGGIGTDDWTELINLATRLDLKRGDPVFLQGDAADAFYAVLAGTVEVRLRTGSGPERVLAEHTAGAVLGETSLFLGGEHSASTYASGPATLLRFRTDDFMKLYEAKHTGAMRVLYNMGHALAQRLRSADDQIGANSPQPSVVRNTKAQGQRYLP